MKRLLYLLFALALAPLGFAQKNPINFESGGFGASWTWNVFENATNPALEFVDNPNPSGINTSSKVAKFTALGAGQPWAGTETAHGAANLGGFVLDANNATIKIMVYKSVISDVGIKLTATSGWAEAEIKKPNTKINEWEELTFDFSGRVNPPATEGQFDQIVVFPDFNLGGRGQDNIIYFDNITFSASATPPPTGPTAAAPTPTRAAGDVISLFSDAYTNVPVDTWKTGWSNATLEEVTIAGNAAKKYSALDFVGIETVASQINVSQMGGIHLDIWSPNVTSLGIKLVDFGANGAFGGGDDVEHQVNIANPAQGQWVSLDIPLSDFTGLTTKNNIAQIILVGVPTATSTVYVDNVYFYKTATPPPAAPTAAAPTPARRLPTDVISLFSDAYTNVPVDTWKTSWSNATLEDVTIAGNATKKYSALDFVGIETVASQINATNMNYFHLDVWSPNVTSFGVKLVDFGANGAFGGGDDVEHQVNIANPAQGQWVSLDIPLSDFTGLTTKKNIAQIIFVGVPTATSTVYVDNVYFHNNITVATEKEELPDGMSITGNYPNPFNTSTTFKYTLSNATQVAFEVLDGLGRVIDQGKIGYQGPGEYSLPYENGQLSNGVYFLRLKTDTKYLVRKFMVIN